MTSLSTATAAFARHAALEQRARLLEAIWDDVHGERRVLQHRALPDRLLIGLAHGCQSLDMYAADIMPCPDGILRVVRDYVGQHPGAALLEAPLLAAFLPRLCRLLLGQPLRLASMPVWWLGEPEIWPLLAAHGRRFSIRDGFCPESEGIALSELPNERRPWLQAMVEADPSRFVARLNLGTASQVATRWECQRNL